VKKLSQKVVNLLTKKRLKISFAESCTGGLLSSSITSISGSSKIFTLGLVTYSNQSKISILEVPKSIIRKNGAVSYETCLSMVNNLNKIAKTIAQNIGSIKSIINVAKSRLTAVNRMMNAFLLFI